MLRLIPNIDPTNTFVTGDLHFGHANIIKYCHRPFLSEEDQEELDRRGGKWHNGSWKGEGASDWRISSESVDIMDETLLDNINKTVPENATLICVGDFALMPKKLNDIQQMDRYRLLRQKIRCRKVHIIWGNHDKIALMSGFDFYDYVGKIKLHNLEIVFSHYCNAVWDSSHRGALHCYGHSHSAIEEGMDRLMPGRKSMDVGVDNAFKILGEYRPFSLKEIVARLGSRPGFSINNSIPTSYVGKTEEEAHGE